MLEWTFLGTGAGTPSRTRNVSSLALRLPQRSEWWLFDCGEGTQHQLLRMPHLRLSQLTRIFVTHLHGDHFYGLPGLLASRGLALGGASEVTIHGPDGLGRWLNSTLRLTGNRPAYPIVNDVVAPGWSLTELGFTVDVCQTDHRTESYAYRIREADNPGAFDIQKAKADGLPPGRLFGQLKAGEIVTLPDGRVVNGADYVGETKRGRMTVYSGDTRPSDAVIALATGADLLIHEATFHASEQVQAEKSAHSTSREAAKVALSAGVKELIITHFSSRYDPEPADVGIEMLLQDAQTVFPNTRLAGDFQRFSIERPTV